MIHKRTIATLAALFVLCFLGPAGTANSQMKPPVGIRQNTPSVHALTNARLVIAPGKTVDKGTIVVRDGIIIAAGTGVPIPADARIWDLAGLTVYPGLIDAYSDLGMPKKAAAPMGPDQSPPQLDVRGPRHWNPNVMSSTRAEELYQPDPKSTEKLRSLGFTAVQIVPQKGIFRGSTALINVGDGPTGLLLVRPDVAQYVTFETSQGDDYPNSLMGSIALIRQTILDAQWHRSAMDAVAKHPEEPRPEFVNDLASLENVITGKQPVMLESTDEISLLRASTVAKEFGLKAWVRGSGSEYRALDAVKRTNLPIILPVNFPEPPAVQSAEDALNVSLQDLRYWDEAPDNPAVLEKAGIPFALTTATFKDISNFFPNLRKAVARGLTPSTALASLTTVPAKLFGVERQLGTLEAGKIANFVITDGDLFSEKMKIRETWVAGKRYVVKGTPETEPRGTWTMSAAGGWLDSLVVVVGGEPDALQGSVKSHGRETKLSNVSFGDLRLLFSFTGDSLGSPGIVRISGIIGGKTFIGTAELADGSKATLRGSLTASFVLPPDTTKPPPVVRSSFPPNYPPGEFGRASLPAQPATLFIRGATVWTCAEKGRLQSADILVERGKIAAIGNNLPVPADALIVEASGKNVTPGLIDCHSHSAAAGSVNETGQTITAEVRIGDILDPYDIAIYRELAGGLTVANVLHGSANPIGGQNQVIKLRWGALPDELKFEGATPGIKFALGENPKQSNWGGDRATQRYPQSRAGVEEIIRDQFRAARDYEQTWKDFRDGKRSIPPRRDLRMDAVLEVLQGKRLVHSHSYRQDEILMLMRVAEEFGFRVATFQHVLEGYKVADEVARHGAGASMFSDWWAYKFEVYDAIPYNGALMHDAGVVVSFNSDSDELARRLNTEAAKAVKYGGVSEEEALRFVTLNPARQLHIDQRVGSLEVGKDADFAIWSGNPLSSYSVCEQTWIDGRRYFDRAEDQAMNQEIQKERAVIIQKILGGKKATSGERRPESSLDRGKGYSCHDGDSQREEH